MEANIPYHPEDDFITRGFKYIVNQLTENGISRNMIHKAAHIDTRTLNNLLNGGGYNREQQLKHLVNVALNKFSDRLPQNEGGYPLIMQHLGAEMMGIVMSGWQ